MKNQKRSLRSIRPETYFIVQWWMTEKLNLRANELLIFAYIYNISLKHAKLTSMEIAKRLSIPYRTVSRLTNSLTSRGYIQKKEKTSENGLFYVFWIDWDGIDKILMDEID